MDKRLSCRRRRSLSQPSLAPAAAAGSGAGPCRAEGVALALGELLAARCRRDKEGRGGRGEPAEREVGPVQRRYRTTRPPRYSDGPGPHDESAVVRRRRSHGPARPAPSAAE